MRVLLTNISTVFIFLKLRYLEIMDDPKNGHSKRSLRGRDKKDDKRRRKNELEFSLSTKFDRNNEHTPLILIELSKTEWKEYKPYSIHLSTLSIFNDHERKLEHYNKVSYSNIEFGKHLKSKNGSLDMREIELKLDDPNEKCKVHEFLIERMKRNKLFITTTREDANKLNPNAIYVTTSNKISEQTYRWKPSGVVIIAMFKSCSEKASFVWDTDVSNKIHSSKPNIVANSKTAHFNSQGYIASFGNKGFFGMTDETSSVNQYVTKKSKKETTQARIIETATELENICAAQVSIGIGLLNKVLSQTTDIVAPLLKIGYDLQMLHGSVNFQEVLTSKDGLWHSEVCENAVTHIFHTERDPTYTLITVPEQARKNDDPNTRREHTIFLFQFNKEFTLGVRMVNSLSFIFHGLLLTHRQHCNDGYLVEEERKKKDIFLMLHAMATRDFIGT